MTPSKIYYGNKLIYTGGRPIESVRGLYYPEPLASAYSIATLASGGVQAVGNVLAIPKTGNISHLVVGHAGVTTPAPMRITIERLSPATGFPADWFNPDLIDPNASIIYTPSITNNQTELAFSTPISVNRGDVVGVVVRPNDPNEAHSVQFRRIQAGMNLSLPASITLPANNINNRHGTVFDIYFKYDDGTYPYNTNMYPPETIGGTGNYNESTVLFNEVGNEFILPFDLKVEGLWCSVLSSSADSYYSANLYDSDDNVIASMNRPVLLGITGNIPQATYFNDDIELKANTLYRMGIKATSPININGRYTLTPPEKATTLSGGDRFKYIQRKDSGPWQYFADRRYMGGLILSGV